MEDIKDRKDVLKLVSMFYSKVRKNDLLGPIFNNHIHEEKWPDHIEKLTDFWETNLFGVTKFKGNPTLKHIIVDNNLNNSINQVHFGTWIQLWFETIDQLYVGVLAEKAKRSARKMGTGQYLAIWKNRPKLDD